MNCTTIRLFARGCAALVILASAASGARATTIVAAKTDNLLHNQTALLLKGVLLYRSGHDGHERIVINVPYRPRISNAQ